MKTRVSADLPHLDHLPRVRSGVLQVVRWPVGFLIRRYWKVRLHGQDNVPATGPVILAVNHIGILDGPLIVALTKRHSFALAKSEAFSGLVGKIFLLCGQIPIDRSRIDTTAISRSIQVLRAGHLLAVFPEGSRGAGEVVRARGGAAYLALVTGAPVVPVALLGTREAGQTRDEVPRRGRPIHVVFGEPMMVEAESWPRTQTSVRELTERVRKHLADHVVEAQAATGLPLPGPPKPLPAKSA